MATEEKEKGCEGGAGGKFRKRPFRSRNQTTPYDRPPTSLRNPNSKNNGWLSKLVDPAQRLITYSAHSLFSSLFRKRLPPPSSETEREARNNHPQEDAAFVTNNSSGTQQGPVGGSDAQINCSEGAGLTELEKILKQKTFTRSEIDHLTALMRLRTVNAPVREEEKGTEMVPAEPMLLSGQKEYPKTPALENGTKNGLVVTPHVASSFPVEDGSSPAEFAKSYMGSRPTKVSSSILGMQTLALREDPTLVNSENVPLKSPIMSIVPRATRHAAVHENGFVTLRSRGRSAIYNMARTPYARIYPTSTLKGGGRAVEGEPSSSSQFALDHDVHSGSKLGSVKRRSSVFDNDIGSVGPVRRIRQKSNLLYSKGSSSPISGSSSSFATSGMVLDAAQQPLSSMQKPAKENVDDIIPSSSFPSLPPKSSEVASKILHQLDKLVSPKEKSSELRLPIVNDNSPTKLSPSMLRGQALRSMEMVDSSKLLDSVDGNKLDVPFGNLSTSAQNQKSNSQRDKIENGPLKLIAPSTGLFPLVTAADATNPRNQVLSSVKCGDSFMIKSVSGPPQKKRAFHMSAPEDCLDLDDDDAYPNGAVASFSTVQKEMTSTTAVMEKTTSGTEAIAEENPSALSVIMPPKSSTIHGEAHVGTADESRVGEKVDASISTTSCILDPIFKPFTSPTQTSFGFDKPASPNGSIVKPSFTFGNKVVSSMEFMAPGAPSKEITKSGPIFGLENIVSSKEPVADAPLVDFGSNKNVNKVPSMPFTAPFLKCGASSDSKLGSSISSSTVTGVTDSMPEVRESDNGNTETSKDTGSSVTASELAISSAASTLLTSSKSLFNFGQNSNQYNGSLFSSPTFSSFPPPVSNIFSSSSSAAPSSGVSATENSTSVATITPATIASSNSSSSTVAAFSSSATSFFKFGSSPVQSAGLPVSSSGSEPPETKSRQDAGTVGLSSTAFGSSSAGSGIFGFSSSAMTTVNSQSQSSAVGASSGSVLGAQASFRQDAGTVGLSSTAFGSSSAGSGIFGFSSSAMTTVNSQSQSSAVGASSGSVLGAQASFTSGFATSTQTQSVSFGSSASSSSLGLTGNSPFLSSSSFPSSNPAASAAFPSGSSLFPSSSPATNVFNSGTSFGLGTSASSSAVNSVSSNSGPSSTLLGCSWQPSKSPFGSTFSTSLSSGFSFATSTASVTSASSPSMFLSTSSATNPQFSFTPAAAASTSTQPAFGNPNPAFTFGSSPVNNGQMNMEDSMAEDTGQATPPATSVYSQQPAPVQSNFVFGASTPSGGTPFQFGSQQNIAPQNPSPFQASGSLGGSFSLGTGGGDKSARRIVKVKHKPRKK